MNYANRIKAVLVSKGLTHDRAARVFSAFVGYDVPGVTFKGWIKGRTPSRAYRQALDEWLASVEQ